MLVLSRKTSERILIGDSVEIVVIEVKGDQVRIGIDAPRSLPVYRKEVYEEIKEENRRAAGVSKPERLGDLERLFKVSLHTK